MVITQSNYAFANITASTTDGALVAAVQGKKIRVLAAFVIAGGTATAVTFNTKPTGAGTAKSATIAAPANGGVSIQYADQGWFETNVGEGLSVTTGAGSTVGIQVVYSLV